MHSEPLTVDKLIKGIKPEGFISKVILTLNYFQSFVKKIIEDDIFRSNTIIESQRELFEI
jgi:hypothetical protein